MIDGRRAKKLQTTMLIVNFVKAFDSIHGEKIQQILLAYGQPKEIIAAIKMLYKNTKVKVHYPDGDKDFFDIVADVLPGDTLVPPLLSPVKTICFEHQLIK